MASICITGTSVKSLHLLSSKLITSGMSAPQALMRDSSFDIYKWHDRVAATLADAKSKSDGSTGHMDAPSRLWEQLAVDLVLANMEAPCWGWAHEGAVDLLDFWAQLESSTRFVLVCEDSRSFICRLIESGAQLQDINAALHQWQQRQQTMLRFHLRNPAISVLVWSTEVQTRPEEIVQQIREAWHLELETLDAQGAHLDMPNALALQIAHQIQTGHPEASALDHEIQALIGPCAFADIQSPPSMADIMSHYWSLYQRSEKLSEQQTVSAELKKQLATEQVAHAELQNHYDTEAAAKSAIESIVKDLQGKSDLLLQQLHLVQDELEKQFLENQEAQHLNKTEAVAKQDALKKLADEQITVAELKKQRDSEVAAKNTALKQLAAEQATSAELKKQRDSESSALQASGIKVKDLEEESDLLLQQLHLVQEELEKQFNLHKEAQQLNKTEAAAKQAALKQLATEQATSAELKKQRDSETAAKQDAQKKLAAEQTAATELKKQRDTEVSAKQDALKQIAAEQAASAELKKQRDSEATAKQDALKQLAAEKTAAAELKKQRDSEAAAKTAIETKAKDLQEESDLLLQQLHLVQEELENYYLKHKDQQHQVKQLQARWLRAVGKHPALQDFETVEIIQESDSDNTTLWRINQLKANGQVLGPFEFKTVIDNGVAGFVFSKDERGQSPIQRWPVIVAKDNELAIIPVKGRDDPQKRKATILQLGTTDWYMVRQLTDALIKALSAADVKPQLHSVQTWLSGLQAQKQILDKVPALLRFDAVKFTGQQNTATKSVIGLQLSQADLQGIQTSLFDFQVQLNFSTTGTVISGHLIFDEKTSGAPFESWTSNVKSSGGQPVMAMMLSPSGWDQKLWHQISPQDQQWLKNIAVLLPTLWASLQQQSTRLEKGWALWVQAATDMRTWAQQVVLPPISQTTTTTDTTADTPPAPLQAPEAVHPKIRAPRPPRAAQKASTKSPNKEPIKLPASPQVPALGQTTSTASGPTDAPANGNTLAKPLPKPQKAALAQTTARPKKPSATHNSVQVAAPTRRHAA